MIIHQFFVPGIAHSSYIVAGNKSCAVVDPERDISRYIDAAMNMGLRITHILETHLHADFISGHIDLAKATRAPIYAPKAGNCLFPHVPLLEGDEIQLEDIRFSVMETAGHTPEHICYIAADTGRGRRRWPHSQATPSLWEMLAGPTYFREDLRSWRHRCSITSMKRSSSFRMNARSIPPMGWDRSAEEP